MRYLLLFERLQVHVNQVGPGLLLLEQVDALDDLSIAHFVFAYVHFDSLVQHLLVDRLNQFFEVCLKRKRLDLAFFDLHHLNQLPFAVVIVPR